MRTKGYLDVEAVHQILAQQVRRKSQKIMSKILLMLSRCRNAGFVKHNKHREVIACNNCVPEVQSFGSGQHVAFGAWRCPAGTGVD
jgi:hypothetical protein